MKSAATAIPNVHFSNPRLARLGIEVMTLAELRNNTTVQLLSAPQRVDFHHVLFLLDGSSRHTIDFVEHPLQPGSILLVRPGQVQQWHLTDDLHGQLILITPESLAFATNTATAVQELVDLEHWPSVSKPAEDVFFDAVAQTSKMRADIDCFDGSPIETAIVRQELLVILLRLARMLREEESAPEVVQAQKLYKLFCRELEIRFRMRPSVIDLAKHIGYSESTLSRACLAATGHTAKEAIDQRIALEAKRQLAHSKSTIVEIGYGLGFADSTNFVKFFKRTVGATPLAFRAGQRPGKYRSPGNSA